MNGKTITEERRGEGRQVFLAKVDKKKVPVAPSESKDELEFRAFRCSNCGRFLLYEAVIIGAIKTKCRGCKTWNILDIIPDSAIIEEESVEKAV